MQQERTRIFSHITRSRFLHLEDALTPAAPGKPGKIRFFVGSYTKGQGSQATAYHFLDDDDARPLMADLSWSKPVDHVDYKGSANGSQPISRVLKVKGPKDGKYWLQVDNGPGEVIGQGAVKPKGEPEASISIALTIWEARKMALAVIEYTAAYRVTQLLVVNFGRADEMIGSSGGPGLEGDRTQTRHMDPSTGEISDAEALFGSEPTPSGSGSEPERTQKAEAKETPAEVDPPVFFALANQAIKAGFPMDKLQEIIKSQIPWRQKHIELQQAMAA